MTSSNPHCPVIPVPEVDSHDHVGIANRINGHFARVAKDISPLCREKLSTYIPALPCPSVEPWEIYRELKSISITRAGGPDGIPARVIKEFACELCTVYP